MAASHGGGNMDHDNWYLKDFSTTARLFKLVSDLPADKQLKLIEQLTKNDRLKQLFKLIIDLPENQKLDLLHHLEDRPIEDMPSTTITLAESSLRENPRKPCLIQVACKVEARSFSSYIVDISLVGVFIETREDFNVGQSIKLAFALPGHRQPLKIEGKIVWRGLQGIGVKFINLTHRQEDSIESFVQNNRVD
jgi:Tfp pilus assembly protein PilZ